MEYKTNGPNFFFQENSVDAKVHLIKVKMNTTHQRSVLKNSEVEYPRYI